jgi:hypothetical protein
MIGQKKSAILEWAILLGLTACALVVSEAIGLNQLWEDGVVYTVVVFAVVITALRPAWGRQSFWGSLALIFAGHMIVLLVLLEAMPPRRFGIPKLLLVPVGGIEGIFLTAVLWGRMKAIRPSRPSS